MNRCEQELCTRWGGDGLVCNCALLGLEPDVVGERLNPCPDCGEHINDDILRRTPECPHGWEPVTGPADLAELHAEAWRPEETNRTALGADQ